MQHDFGTFYGGIRTDLVLVVVVSGKSSASIIVYVCAPVVSSGTYSIAVNSSVCFLNSLSQ